MKRRNEQSDMEEEFSDTEMQSDDVEIYSPDHRTEKIVLAHNPLSDQIEIRPPNYDVKFKGIPEFDGSVLQPHFATMLVGRPNSGKSHLIYEYLTNPSMYFQQFNRVIFVTPNTKIGGITQDQMEFYSAKFDLGWIHQQIKNFNEEVALKYPTAESLKAKFGEDRDPFNILLLLDDCIAEIKKHQFDEKLKELFYNRRWLVKNGCMSVLLTAEYYYDLPKSLRSNLSSLVVFNCTPRDWKTLQEETLYENGALTSKVEEKCVEIFSIDNAFVYIDVEKSLIYAGFKETLNQKRLEKEGELLIKKKKF